MDVLILGNGFDLAHGLKTRYKDFLDYYSQKEKAKNFDGAFIDSENLKNVWLYHFVNKQKQLGDKWIDLEEEIYNVIKKIDEGIKERGIQLNDYTGTTSRAFFVIIDRCLWTEFEESSLDLSKIFDGLESYYDKYSGRTIELSNEEKQKTYKLLIPFLYEQLRTFTNEFNNYLSKEVLKNIGSKKYKLNLSKNARIRVLNFNYTNTYEKLYDSHSSTAEANPKYVYIHGKVCNLKDSNLILGTKSFYNKKIKGLNDKEEIDVEFNMFKKHNQRHRYATIEDYQNLLIMLGNLPVNETLTFHVVGHSLAESDHNILKHIFKVRKNYKINIYYHNQEALERLINNITDIIGEEEVMAKVSFIYQEDINRGILTSKK